MSEARARTPLLIAAGALLLGSVVLIGSHRCSPDPAGQAPRAGRSPVRPPEVAGAAVAIECRVFEVPPAPAPDPGVAAVVDPLVNGGPSGLDEASADALGASLEALVASGRVSILSSSRVAVRTSEAATLSLAQVPGPKGTPVRFELSVEYRPVAREDGTIDLSAVFNAKRLEGELATVLDDFGLPAGDRASARVMVTVPEGGAAVWTRNLGDSLLVIVARATAGD